MILAAGRGERMRPLTDAVPKPLLELNDRPLIVHLVERLVAAGFRELVINLGYRGRQIRECLGDGARWGASIAWSDEGDAPIGTGAGIVRALPLLVGDDGAGDAKGSPFVVVSADVWTDFRFERLRQWRASAARAAHLVLVPNPEHHPDGDFAFRAGLVRHAAAETAPRPFTFSGIGVFTPAVFTPRLEGATALLPWLERACAQGTVTGEAHFGAWSDVGTPERLAALRAQLAPSEEREKR